MFQSKSIVTLFGNLKNVTPVPPSLMAAVDEQWLQLGCIHE